ncbi:endonuclease [Nocardioidaceae bacterium]|nr:endonuclease [Nocardioidaceae bacterium]
MSQTLDHLLDEHGQTHSAEADINLRDEPAPLFQLLVLTNLLAANLSADLGVRTAAELRKEFRTAHAMADASTDEVRAVLEETRFLRKDQTAQQLHDTAAHVVERWDDDLRGMREVADGDAGRLAELVAECPGIGPVGARIFVREVQTIWTELQPYADEHVLELAAAAGLPETAEDLAEMLGDDDLSVLGAALVRAEHEGQLDEEGMDLDTEPEADHEDEDAPAAESEQED